MVIPCHDGMPDVLDAVRSALTQSRPPDEVVLVDDASTDGSAEHVEAAFPGRVRLVRGRFGSAAAARNAGWRSAQGDWIAFLDADDLWMPDKLEVAERTLSSAPSAIWFFSDGAFRTLDGTTHDSWFGLYADLIEPYCGSPVAQLLEVNFVLTSSTLVRRTALEAERGFDESLSHAEDVDLWIRLSRRGEATASRRALVRYQHREGGLTRLTELRLVGGATLFGRLARDPSLAPALRRQARRRASLYRYKLGFHALREGRTAEARARFAAAWQFPERVVPILLGLAASFLPPALFQRLRGQRAAKAAATPMMALQRVRLESSHMPSEAAGQATR